MQSLVDIWAFITLKELLILILGAVLAVILQLIVDFARKRSWKNSNKMQRKRISGKYYGYHLHTDNSGQIIESEWIIKQTWFNGISVSVRHPSFRSEYIFNGKIKFYQSHIYFNLYSDIELEEMHFVFYLPKSCWLDIELGTAICIGQTGNPYAGFQIISKCQLSDEQVYKILGVKRILVVGDKEIMRIKAIEKQ